MINVYDSLSDIQIGEITTTISGGIIAEKECFKNSNICKVNFRIHSLNKISITNASTICTVPDDFKPRYAQKILFFASVDSGLFTDYIGYITTDGNIINAHGGLINITQIIVFADYII